MLHRTTITTLRVLTETLNEVTGNSVDAWQQTDNGSRAVPGVYVLDCAYGGYRLCQIVNEHGGERELTPRYNAGVTADLIRAYMAGWLNKQKEAAQ